MFATEQAMEKTLIDLSKEAKLDSTKFFFVSIHFKNVNHFFANTHTLSSAIVLFRNN